MLQVQAIGRAGRDAEIREHNGRQFMTFSVAVDDSYKNSNGTKVESTIWVDCISEQTSIAQYLLKGTLVFIQGRGKVETYESQQDRKTYAKLKVNVRQIQLCGSPKEQTVAPAAQAPQRQPTGQPAPAVPPVKMPEANLPAFATAFSQNDDMPF